MATEWDMKWNKGFGLNGWGLHDEMHYARSLVEEWAAHTRQIPQKKLLSNYVRSARKRQKWGTYPENGEEIIHYVEEAIEAL